MTLTTKSEESFGEEKQEIKAIILSDGVLVPKSEVTEGLTARGYGLPNDIGLMLCFSEALYLLSKKIIEVRAEKAGKNLIFQELLETAIKSNEDAWIRYLIYRDLRSRGYVVREGFGSGIDFRVYKRGTYGKSAAGYLVLGIKEGLLVSVESLARILTQVQSQKKILILSVLNRRGEIVYYSLSRLSFR